MIAQDDASPAPALPSTVDTNVEGKPDHANNNAQGIPETPPNLKMAKNATVEGEKPQSHLSMCPK